MRWAIRTALLPPSLVSCTSATPTLPSPIKGEGLEARIIAVQVTALDKDILVGVPA